MRIHKEIIICLVLFAIALGVRLQYQNESIVDHPLRADAAGYFSAAYNLRYFNAYSLEVPRLRGIRLGEHQGPRPASRTDRSPGYPIFQSMLMTDGERVPDFIDRVLKVQAVLGALVAVFVFLMARPILPAAWAAVAGTLTAISPHLIAMDGYMLTESLYVFLITGGVLLLMLAWRSDNLLLTLAGGLVIALSFQVRAVSALAPIFLASAFVYAARERGLRKKTMAAAHVAIIAASLVAVVAGHRVFVHQYVTNMDEIQWEQKKYVSFTEPLSHYMRNLRPPNFYVRNESHVYTRNLDRSWKYPTRLNFRDIPAKYVLWDAWDKFVIMHSWDNAYYEGVYIYPMNRKGFETSKILFVLHKIMFNLHPILLFLSFFGIVLLFVRWFKRSLPNHQRALILPALMFVYLVLVLYFLSWLPRYTIPDLPFMFILAVATLAWLIPILKSVARTSSSSPSV